MATTATTRIKQETACTPTLFLAFELGVKTWQRGFTTGAAQRPRERPGPAGACHTVLEERRRAKSRCGLPEAARGVRGDEAGRVGLGLQRFCISQGVEHAVVDAARRAGHRRSRRAQTERLAVPKLRTMRRRQTAGAQQVGRVGRVPSGVEEDRRQLPRARLPTKRDRTRGSHRITGLRAGSGMRLAWHGEVEPQRAEVRPWAGTPLPTAGRARLQREWPKGPGLTAPRGERRGVPGQSGRGSRAARGPRGAGLGARGPGSW